MTMQEKTIDKIKKLMDHAASCEKIGYAEEAQAFMGKVQKLCNKHRIDISEAEMFDPGNEDSTIDQESGSFDFNSDYYSNKRIWWQNQLARLIATNNNCSYLVQSGTNKIWFVGRTRDRQISIYLFQYIVRSISDYAQTQYQRVYDQHYALGTHAECRGWKKSFLTGFVKGVSDQYRQLARELEVEVGEDRFALVTTSQLVAVRAYIDDKYSRNASSLNGSSSSNTDGYGAGRDKGMNTNLAGNGIAGGSRTIKQLKN